MADQGDRIRRQVMSTDEAERIANEYEALLDVAEAAQTFWEGNTHDSPASDPLCLALVRLDAVRGNA